MREIGENIGDGVDVVIVDVVFVEVEDFEGSRRRVGGGGGDVEGFGKIVCVVLWDDVYG